MRTDVWVRARAVIVGAQHGAARPRGQPRRPPRYKTAVVTWLAIYPLVLALSTLLSRLELGLPPPLSILLVTVVTVLVATYGTIPVLSWILRRWLVPMRDREQNRDPPR